MSFNGEKSPFILRFSKSMYKANPRVGRGGKPRLSEGKYPDVLQISKNISDGYSFYKKYEYNSSQPIFSRIRLKPDSISKSLRFHFINTTKIQLLCSLDVDSFVFSLNSERDMKRVSSIIKHSRNKSFQASLSHIKDIDIPTPKDKISLSEKFISKLRDAPCEHFYINLFDKNADISSLIKFLKNDINCKTLEIIRLERFTTIKVLLPNIKSNLEILCTNSLIKSFSEKSDITFNEHYIRHHDLKLDCILRRDFEKSYPKAGVIDSGLSEESFLKEWELGTESFISQDEKNTRHGTFVLGRLLMNDEKFGEILFLNIEIMPGKNSKMTPEKFYENIKEVLVKYYKKVKIYNISLGTNNIVTEDYSLTAHIFDVLQKEFDVLFIISAGNYENLNTPSGELDDNRITSPAESIHSITVGSISHQDTNIQKKNSPSLFTRCGRGPGGVIKPEVVSYGGAHEKKFGKLKPVGVYSIGIRNELAEDIGTSHAVPIVTGFAAKIFEKYRHVFKSPDMTKALIINYAVTSEKLDSPDYFKGYGIIDKKYAQEDDSVIYMHNGTAKMGNIVEIPEIPIPQEMFDGIKAYGSVTATLVYKTETDLNFPRHYTCTNLEISIGFYRKDKWQAVITSSNLLGLPDEVIYSKKEINERFKWNPVKVYRKHLKGAFLPKILTLRIIPSKRDFFNKKPDIQYSLVISFSRKDRNLYNCLEKTYKDYNGLLEPASDSWKTCG
jgi:hypothetical protein